MAQLKQHCDYQQAAYDGLEKQKVLEVQRLEDKLRQLRDENVALTLQVDKLAQEVARKDPQKAAVSQRPHHPSQMSSITITA